MTKRKKEKQCQKPLDALEYSIIRKTSPCSGCFVGSMTIHVIVLGFICHGLVAFAPEVGCMGFGVWISGKLFCSFGFGLLVCACFHFRLTRKSLVSKYVGCAIQH